MRRPRPVGAWERRRGVLALKRLPSRLFEGGERTEEKSIGKEQEACDGMANRVSALMFQMLGEPVAWLAVLRASAQPCTISSKHIHTKGSCVAFRFTHIHSLKHTKEKDLLIRSSTLCFLTPFQQSTILDNQPHCHKHFGVVTMVWFCMIYATFNSKSRTIADNKRQKKGRK